MLKSVLAVCFFFTWVLVSAQDGERILEYHSDIEVLEDGTMSVKESIKVQSQGINIRRGIFRSFPVKYKDRYGNTVKVRFHVEEVRKNGFNEPYHLKTEGRFVNLYIGDANTYLSPDVYNYEIQYSTSRQLGYFKDYDELYWNAIGTGWAFPIDKGSATITLPAAADILQFTGYSGFQGETGGCQCSLIQEGSSTLQVEMTQPLQAYQGLTVAVSWPKGVVREPTMRDRLNWFFRDNKSALYGLTGLVLVFVYYLYAWDQVGRDPKEQTVVPLFKSPDDLSPAASRYILKMGFDNQAFAASIVSMAVKGAIKITEKKKVYTLEKINDKVADLSSAEKLMLSQLFKSGATSIKLTNKKHAVISATRSALKGSLKNDFHKEYFKLNRKWLIPGILLTVLSLAVMFITSDFDTNGDDFGIFLWLSIWTVGCTALVSAAIGAWKNVIANGWAQRGMAIFLTFFSLPFLGAEFLVIALSGVRFPLLLLVVAALLLLVNILFYYWLEAPTVFGRKIMDKIEGFKMYLSTAEKHRMNLINPPDRTPEHFEKMLPYAIALGVANQWGDQFEGILDAAQTGPQQAQGYHPVWYSGTANWSDLGSTKFASNLSSSFSKALVSSSVPPGSSSSGGGGFSGGGGSSGGGGGGGGGGGW